MKKLIVICLLFLATKNYSQCTNTVSPSTQSVACTGSAVVVSFTATALSPTTNVRHDWYSPLNPLPGGSPVYTSTNAVSVLSGSFSPGIYTVTTTDLGTLCQISKTFAITSPSAYPSFSVSVTSPSVGCAGSTTTLGFLNAISQQTPPGICSFSFLPPGFAGTLAVGPLGINTSTITSLAGTWTMVLVDNSNNCRAILPVQIYSSSTTISFNHTVNPGGVVNFQSTSTGTNGGTTYSWDFGDGSVGSGAVTSHTYTNGGIHNVTLNSSNPSCNSNSTPVNVTTIPCTANSNFTLVYSGTPQNWLAYPAYYGNVTNAVWNWGDGLSDNAMFPVHTYSAAGIYNICLSVTVSCAGTSSTCSGYNIYKMVDVNQAMVTVSVVSAPPLGLKNLQEVEIPFSLYPNPSNGNFYIQNPSQKSGTVKVFNLEGKEIENLILENNKETKIENLNAGIYFVEINSGNFIYRKKVVVTN